MIGVGPVPERLPSSMTDPQYPGQYPPAQQQAAYPGQSYDQVSAPPGNAMQPYVPPQAWNAPAVYGPAAYPPAVYAPAPVAQWAPQPGFRLVGAGGRLGAVLLDGVLLLVTFGIGWLIWAMITWAGGQTPGKQLLGHVVADATTGEAFGWGRMFLREVLIRSLLFWIPNALTFGLFGLIDALMVFRSDGRTLHDMTAGSIVRHN